jgi:mono/diheme cytochrome c family protein
LPLLYGERFGAYGRTTVNTPLLPARLPGRVARQRGGASVLVLSVLIAGMAGALGTSRVEAAEAAGDVALDPGARRPEARVEASPARLEHGKSQFEAVCGPCHGAGARGGRNGAPDLLASDLAQGPVERFSEFVARGSVERGMPPFPLGASELGDMHAWLASLAAARPSRGQPTIALVGDADRGRAWFEGAGRCAQCHSVAGDLRGIGARYPARVLQGRIVLPRGNGVHPGLIALGVRIPGVTDGAAVADSPRTVTVGGPGREAVTGQLLAISDFDVALRDADGRYRSFVRNGAIPRVVIHDPAQPHIDMLGHLPDDALHDLTAYLASLK